MTDAEMDDETPIDEADEPLDLDLEPEVDGAGALSGVAAIRAVLKTLPQGPGVYRMLNGEGDVIYVGKARSLNKRVANYTKLAGQPLRILRMIQATRSMEIVTTGSEVEALLLESNLIKRYRPRYNVLLRDDKSFPHIVIRADHAFPQIAKHRGPRDPKHVYFGPFASAGAVNRTLNALQKAFLLRSCTDSVFSNRTRPCLLHQIRRCAGPCVGLVTEPDYGRLVAATENFLAGKSRQVQDDLAINMQAAAEAMEYERAAALRDRLRALAQIQAHQDINPEGVAEADVIAIHQDGGQSCVQIVFIRAGQNWGNRSFFPRHDRMVGSAEVLAAFLGQFYEDKVPPALVLVSEVPDAQALLVEALSLKAGRKVTLVAPKRGEKQGLVAHALNNARDALGRRQAESSSQRALLEKLADVLDLDGPPRRIEVYDNSHIQGSHALGGMIVATPDGFAKNQYRRFNIKGADITPGDDYAMMREVLTRRFSRLMDEETRPDRPDPANQESAEAEGDATWPDLVLIDGGQGQLAVATQVAEELGLEGVTLVGIAKGPDRNAGRERFFMAGRPEFSLEPNSPVLFFLQRLRDEAHRFAIGSHRAKRTKAIAASPLDEIEGIGASRKRALLLHFGSAKAVAGAGIEDLAGVPGISKAVAKRVWDHFNVKS
jgi:excinuclease ABC subunit C